MAVAGNALGINGADSIELGVEAVKVTRSSGRSFLAVGDSSYSQKLLGLTLQEERAFGAALVVPRQNKRNL